MEHTTKTSRDIRASADKIFNALTDPALMVKWRVPGDMTAKIHNFDLKVGGGYEMSLFYPIENTEGKGKTDLKEDRFTARIIELVPNKKITEVIVFDTTEANLKGEMIMEVSLQSLDAVTRVTFLFKDIPPGIKSEDNEAGTISSLEKLARLVEK